ncbi:MAG: OmpA family protein [Bacteroidetes bacterium]|nr:OmpA family protein [Bacteroidota bacterium]
MKKFFLPLIFLVVLSGAGRFLSAQTPKGWTKRNAFPEGALEKAVAFTIADKGYAGLGTDNSGFKKNFWQYDAKSDAWSEMEKFPGEPRISAAGFSIGTKGYAGTGMTGSQNMQQGANDFWEFDPQKNSWKQKANFPGGIRYGAVGFSIGTKGYIGLGVNKNTHYSDLWEYDPLANKWTKKSDFPAGGRADASVFVIGEEVYVLLGQGKEIFPSQKDAWKFSPAKNEWKKIADFPGNARIGVLAFSNGKYGYVANGYNGTLKRYADFWEYDASTDKWKQKEDVPYGTRDYIFAFAIGNAAYVCTGHGQKNSSGFEVWKYDFPRATENKFALGGTLLLGEERMPLAAVDVKIYNAKNELLKTVSTGLFGSFLFMDLPNNTEYTVEVAVNDPHWRKQNIYLVSRENEAIATLNADTKFRFLLSGEEKSKLQLLRIENKNMRMNMKGKLALSSDKKMPFANAEISLINEEQEVVQVATTDEKGKFFFNYLPVDTNLYLTIDEKATASLPKGTTILLMDDKDSVVNKSIASNSKMLLTSLPPEQNKLSTIFVEDPWMQATFGNPADGMLVMENIYFDVGKWELLPAAKSVLNKAAIMLKNNPKISIEISAHTDSRGDAKSNLELSEKRAQEAKNYIAAQNINTKRISVKGYGETKLLNRCADNVDCTEEEHAQNRRMEFKIIYAK